MRNFVRRHPFISFYVLAFAIASLVVVTRYLYGIQYEHRTGHRFSYNEVLWGLLLEFGHGHMYANMVSIGWAGTREPIYFLVYVFAGAPTISAIVISLVGWGRAGLWKLLSRLKPWPNRAFRKSAVRAYCIIAATFFAITLIQLAMIYVYKSPAEAWGAASPWGWSPWLLPVAFVIGGFIDEGATDEELGWRGFALPVLLAGRWSPLTIAVFLGVLWWAWHLPRDIPDIVAGVTEWPKFIYGQSIFLAMVIAMSIVITWFFHQTGSMISGLLLHAWGNFISKAVSVWDIRQFDDRIWMWWLAAIIIILTTGRSLGRAAYVAKRDVDGPEPELAVTSSG